MKASRVRVFQSEDELAEAAAVELRRLAQDAVKARGRFLLVLSGGSTPKPLYELLASSPYREELPWPKTHVFWADERAVAPDAAENNYRMAHDLLLKHVQIPGEQIHRMRGEEDPVTGAELYVQELLQVAGQGRAWPQFDLVILGLGSDGHTASLFPGSAFPVENSQPVLAVSASYGKRPAARITLTPVALNSARQIFFLVVGTEKADAVAVTLSDVYNPVRNPAQRIQPVEGTVTWFLDQAAAGKLDVQTNK